MSVMLRKTSLEELLIKFIEKEEEIRVEQEIVGLKVQIYDMHEKLEVEEDELYE
ncbi:hypothetical protein RYX36_014351 [Vicia faba]